MSRKIDAMTTIIGPGVQGDLCGRWEHIHTHTHTVTRKDTTCSQQSSQPQSPAASSASSPESGSWSITNAAPAALRPASEVVRRIAVAESYSDVLATNELRQRDREVVLAFAEWWNNGHGYVCWPDQVNDFIRTQLGGEKPC